MQPMNVLVIDGQGGGLGKQLVAALSTQCPEARLTAVGTNSLAANAMRKAGQVFHTEEVRQLKHSKRFCRWLLCTLLWKGSAAWAMSLGAGLVILIRCLSAHFRWSLPKAHPKE